MAVTLDSNSIRVFLARAFNNTMDRITDSSFKIATGNRINYAADDPVGMYVSESLKLRMVTNAAAKKNAEEALSMIQTAEASMDIIDEKLFRMKELAESSATGTYTDTQRTVMQSEFELMASEIDRIATSTEYNGTKILNGNLASTGTWSSSGGWREPTGGVLIHVDWGNTRAEDYYYVTIRDARTSALFTTTNIAVSTQSAAQSALNSVNTAIVRKENARSWLGALENRLEGTINLLEAQYDTMDHAVGNIVGVDYAFEMTNLLNQLIIAQSSIAMMAQANVTAQMTLQLFDSV